MGHMIEEVAVRRGHEIVCHIDKDNAEDIDSDVFRSSDVAIEFTTPQTAENNIRKAWLQGIPVVSGTTGWTERLPLLKHELESNGRALFWTSNYSIGVNLFFSLNRYLARLMRDFPQYNVAMEEVHHVHKLDAPSGTAVSLAEDIIAVSPAKRRWQALADASASSASDAIPIQSVRSGEVPGVHTVSYESGEDVVTIRHSAKSREGFALGAVLAAEFLQGKQGFYDMNDLLHLQ